MKIITIDRVFAAGGHSIGQEVANRLGVELYDRDIIRMAANTSEIEQSQIESEEEQLSRGEAIISAITPMSYELKDMIFDNEREAILQLAEKGACVMIGRCASAILAEAGIETVSVFLHAAPSVRLARAEELLNLTDEAEALAAMRKRDEKRKHYFEHYTTRKWGNAHDFTLCFDTGALSYDYCVDAIANAAQ